MRTTLALADDVAFAARAIAAREGKTMGEVVSDLMRETLHRRSSIVTTRNGLPILVRQGKGTVVTLEMVNALRDEEP